MRKFLQKKETVDTIKFIGILILIFAIFSLLFTFVPPFNKYHIFAVQTDSMDPVIAPGDIVITKEVNPKDVKIGDIMAFHVDITNDGEDDVVVHYINEINIIDDEYFFRTKPHVSELQDSWTIEESDLIGVYQYQVNSVGKILLFAQSWIGRIIILIDIIIISIIYDILFKDSKKNTKKTEEVIEPENKERISNE